MGVQADAQREKQNEKITPRFLWNRGVLDK